MKPDTKAIRARADAATKGPWLIVVEGLRPRVDCERISGFADETVCSFEVRDPPDPNADFVAAARTDVPALCDRVEVLEAALAEAHKYSGCGDAPGSSPECCSICKALVGE